MSLLQKASIITTPTAYAEDYLYSIKPAKVTFNSVTSFANGTTYPLTTFISSGNDITSGIVSSAFGGCVSSAITLKKNQKVKVTFDYTQNSGNELRVLFSGVVTGAGTVISDLTTINATGTFDYTFTITSDTTGYLQLGTGNSGHSINFSALNIRAEVLSLADFDFDRNSTGTRVNEDYLIEDVPYNLLTYSQAFHTTWSNTNSSESLDTSVLAPDGTATSVKLQANAGTHFSFITQTLTMSGQISFSVFMKKGTATTASMFLTEGGNLGLTANLENGTITSVTGSNMVGTVESAGNGWYRFEIKHTSGDDLDNSVRIGVEGGSLGSVTYAGTENIYIWGAQITKGDKKPYLKTTDRLDIPRLDYTNGTASIKLEPQSTNLITYSEDFSQWTASSLTVTDNSAISPDGTLNASKLTAVSGSATKRIQLTSLPTSSVDRSYSIFVKTDNINAMQLLHSGDLQGFARFDLVNYTVGSVGSKTTATIENYGNGWYRCTAIFDSTNAFGSSLYVYISDSATGTYGGGSSQVGDLFIYGAQYEAGSYPTSYIPTNGTTITRAAETLNNAANSDLINSTEGVLYVEALLKDTGTFKTAARITAADISTSDGLWIYFRSDNKIQSVLRVGGVDQTGILSDVQTTDEYYKVAFKFKQNDFSLFVNGIEVATDTSGNTFSADTLSKLGFVLGTSTNPFIGNVKCLAVFKEALTDLELEKLTGYNNHELYLNYYNRLSYLGLVEEYNVESDINNYIL